MERNRGKFMKHDWSKAVGDGYIPSELKPAREPEGDVSKVTRKATSQDQFERLPNEDAEWGGTPMSHYADAEQRMAEESIKGTSTEQKPTVGQAKTRISLKGNTSKEAEDRIMAQTRDKIAREIAQ